jgi:hypothetical protein
MPTSIRRFKPEPVVWEIVRLAGRVSPLDTASTAITASALLGDITQTVTINATAGSQAVRFVWAFIAFLLPLAELNLAGPAIVSSDIGARLEETNLS